MSDPLSLPSVVLVTGTGTEVGKTITTAALVAVIRARAFLTRVELHPLPLAAMSRRISLFAPADGTMPVATDIAGMLKAIMRTRAILPAREVAPWLGDSFAVIT